jgi:CRP-like cAMP-binding protein
MEYFPLALTQNGSALGLTNSLGYNTAVTQVAQRALCRPGSPDKKDARLDEPVFPPRPPTRSELKKNLAELKKAVLRNPLDLDARLRIARTYRLLKKPRHAVEHYRSLARYLAVAAQPLHAMAVAKELLQVSAEDSDTLLFLAKLYARTGAGSRIATPRHESPPSEQLGQWPSTHTGVWRAIRPDGGPLLQVVNLPPAADQDTSGTAPPEPPPLPLDVTADSSMELELPLDEGDVVEERMSSGEHRIEIRTGEIAVEADAVDEEDLEEVSPAQVMDVTTDPSVWIGRLPAMPIFSSLSASALAELTRALVHKRAAADSVLWREGDDAEFVLILAAGELLTWRGEGKTKVILGRLRAGDFAGVFSLLTDQRRHASIKALSDVTYFELHRRVVESLAGANSELARAISAFLCDRVVANALAMLPVFKEMDAEVRHRVARRFKLKRFSDGAELFYQGAELNGLWVVLNGAVHLGHETDSGELQAIRVLSAGHFLGTLAAYDGTSTDCSALAVGEVSTMTLPHRALVDLSQAYPGLKLLPRELAEVGFSVTPRVFGGTMQLPTDLETKFPSRNEKGLGG